MITPVAPLDREAIFAAIFARLQGITSPAIKTCSRKLIDFDAITPPQQPALFLVKGDEENPKPNRSLPPTWILKADIVVFCRNDADPSAAPSTLLNQLLTAIEGAFLRQPMEGFAPGQPYAQSNEWWTSLDGLCSHCWIAGPIIVAEGGAVDQAVAVVPIEVEVSPS